MRTLKTISEEQGWTTAQILSLALEYIGNQDQDDAFIDFLEHAAEEEEEG